MNFEEYINSLAKKLSEVKFNILQELWNAGDSFPRSWVKSSRLLELTKQKYFDRRIRELRDEMGCDIESEHQNGEHSYRLNSESTESYNPRLYLSESQKRSLFENSKFTCHICGRVFAPGIRGLQADHKVPLIREGKHAHDNWQALCNECNVGKRRACADCLDNCQECVWAFPEKVGMVTLVKLPPSLSEGLLKSGATQQTSVEKIIIEAIEKYLKK